MADEKKPDDTKPSKKSTKADEIKASLKEGETYVRGVITRVLPGEDDGPPVIFFNPIDNVSQLELEGHRLSSGELVITHNKLRTPKQFDLKRVALEGDPIPGAEIGLVHLDKNK